MLLASFSINNSNFVFEKTPKVRKKKRNIHDKNWVMFRSVYLTNSFLPPENYCQRYRGIIIWL